MADLGHKTVVIDFDIGLRNLDIHLGCERRVIFDFVNVLQGECTLPQALIKDKRNANLSILAASQTKDKNILTVEGMNPTNYLVVIITYSFILTHNRCRKVIK